MPPPHPPSCLSLPPPEGNSWPHLRLSLAWYSCVSHATKCASCNVEFLFYLQFSPVVFQWLYNCVQLKQHCEDLYTFSLSFVPDLILVYLHAVYANSKQVSIISEKDSYTCLGFELNLSQRERVTQKVFLYKNAPPNSTPKRIPI